MPVSRLSSDLAEALDAVGWLVRGRPTSASTAALERLIDGPEPTESGRRFLSLIDTHPDLAREAADDSSLADALVAVAGSRALTAVVKQRPDSVSSGLAGHLDPPDKASDIDALRSGIAATVGAIAVADLTDRATMPTVGAALARLADWAAAGALALATDDLDVSLAVIAMGKWGGRELNYASDIDVVFVHDPGGPEAAEGARRIAERFMRILSDPHPAGPPLRVDAGLRPEGASGPLSRTLESHEAYWERWGEPWERQAMLKARHAAGHEALGSRFVAASRAFAHPDALPTGAISDIRAMKQRSEASAERGEGTEIKRGVGGIRDVEFAVQLMQLVHGGADDSLRGGNTLESLRHLADAGYIAGDDGETLADAYRWLRDVEHHLQLYDLRQTHQVPADDVGRERLARSMGYRSGDGSSALEHFDLDLIEKRRAVRTVHQRLFYRPLLEAIGERPTVRLEEADLARQLAALGFTDVAGARAAFDDLTTGLSRRSRLMQQYLPLLLDWIAATPDPDLGLQQLRLLVSSRPDNAPLIAALRDDPVAAERLCTLLGTSRLLGRYLDRLPSFLGRLGDDERLRNLPDGATLRSEALKRIALKDDLESRVAALGRMITGYVLWIASADLLGLLGVVRAGQHLADLADAAAAAAIEIAIDDVRDRDPRAGDIGFALVAMGKWGGREMTYASDLDALLVFADPDAADTAKRIAERLVAIFDTIGRLGPALHLDLELRPEGRRGAIARSLDAYEAYYERWADVWEMQALLRARPVAGDQSTLERFMTMAAARPPVDRQELREIVRIKARVEAERVRPGDDPRFHTKLGPGAMADVEWTVQYLTMVHGTVPTPSTLESLSRLAADGHLGTGEAERLSESYRYSAAVRNRLYLLTGRQTDVIPPDGEMVSRLGRSMGYVAAPRQTLLEQYRRVTRRARRVVERRFYGRR